MKMSIHRRLLVLIGIVALLGLGGVLTAVAHPYFIPQEDDTFLPLISIQNRNEEANSPSPVSDGQITQENLGNGVIRYTDHTLGFSIEYPENWYVHDIYAKDDFFQRTCFGNAQDAGELYISPASVCIDMDPWLGSSQDAIGAANIEAAESIFFSTISAKRIGETDRTESIERSVISKGQFKGLPSVELQSLVRENAQSDASNGYEIYIQHPYRGLIRIMYSGIDSEAYIENEYVFRTMYQSLEILGK